MVVHRPPSANLPGKHRKYSLLPAEMTYQHGSVCLGCGTWMFLVQCVQTMKGDRGSRNLSHGQCTAVVDVDSTND